MQCQGSTILPKEASVILCMKKYMVLDSKFWIVGSKNFKRYYKERQNFVLSDRYRLTNFCNHHLDCGQTPLRTGFWICDGKIVFLPESPNIIFCNCRETRTKYENNSISGLAGSSQLKLTCLSPPSGGRPGYRSLSIGVYEISYEWLCKSTSGCHVTFKK
jgi:hypothetical protein